MEYTIEQAKQILKDKNIKVITLSGEPVSGKSTARKGLKEKYEKQGYIIKEISIGDIFREIAEKEGYKSIEDFNEALKKRGDIDRRIDGEVKKFGQRILEEADENTVYIIDSRMAWKNIPYSFAVRLKCNSKVAGNRLFNADRDEIDSYQTEEEACKAAENRKNSEVERYKMRYGVDLSDENNYSLVIDTSYADSEEICDTIIKCEEYDREGKFYAKNWTSPKIFLPTQPIRDTFNINHEKTNQSIKEKGYLPDYPIDAIQANLDGIDYTFAYDGHNRMCSAIKNGITLVPYIIVAKDDEKVPLTKVTVKSYLKGEFNPTNAYDHEDCMKIRYVPDVYPKYPEVSKLKEEAEGADDTDIIR